MGRPDYKFKIWFKIKKSNAFTWYKPTKFRGANYIDFYLFGLKFNWGMPYLRIFVYEQGYDAGFRRD